MKQARQPQNSAQHHECPHASECDQLSTCESSKESEEQRLDTVPAPEWDVRRIQHGFCEFDEKDTEDGQSQGFGQDRSRQEKVRARPGDGEQLQSGLRGHGKQIEAPAAMQHGGEASRKVVGCEAVQQELHDGGCIEIDGAISQQGPE